ncbi:MAG: hypothetical protein HZC55_09930 [Verrucomicrobia bacterium]|nr:hypothetical protein [Verrucomicrobiota bacterium]
MAVGWSALGAGEAPFRQVRWGRVVLSLPAGWGQQGPELPVWLHLHGAPATVEGEVARVGLPGVLVNVTLPGLSKVYADYFAEPRVLGELLAEVETRLRMEMPGREWKVGALAVSSFSAGFGGVRQLLRQPAAVDRIQTLVMADSIYCGYAGDPGRREVDPDLMEGFVGFARLAVAGKRRLLITHTQQVPEGYASTTETADFLIRVLGGTRRAEGQVWSPTLRQISRWSAGGMEIIGFAGSRPEDHLQHLRELGRFLERVRRPVVE